jgi:hypothetical protein
MEASSVRVAPRKSRRAAAIILLLVSGMSVGCITMPVLHWRQETPPSGPVTRIVATWENQVIYTPDSVNGGRDLPGLAARLYLFSGDTGFPVQGDGAVQVDLYDVTNLPPGQQPKFPLERWNYDRDNLKRLLRKDMIGYGYTIFLPWSTYQPEINQVRLVVSYVPEKGAPVYAPQFTMALNSPAAVSPAISQQRVLGKSPGISASTSPSPAQSWRTPPPTPSSGPTRISLPGNRDSAFGKLLGPR